MSRRWEPYSASPAAAAPNPPTAPTAGATVAPDALDAVLASLGAHGAEALRLARAELVALERPADMGTNALSWLGGRVSWHLRRAVLLDALRAHEWNLTRASEALDASSAGSLVRLIRDLGLSKEYAAARKMGAGKPGPKRGAKRAPKDGAT